ncbi:hypothetical protein K6U06_10955 [Acidiferrimicrobium sp. IK]|uniref:hypothetical protein n=1 Tax=Acidiferrimicrobium sp. IK TaxID=2871700 RepID=UPI0021CB62D7|nr:hypothetical protein [Acidiferrimicrobium sp. IK]MCU4184879.1 hypothetical protein [Acidiferrimicrobium sp. IK]
MLWRGLRVRPRLSLASAPGGVVARAGLAAMAVVAGACGSSTSLSAGTTTTVPGATVPKSTVPATTEPATTAPASPSPTVVTGPSSTTPVAVPVVGAPAAGLQQLHWQQVVAVAGTTVTLGYQYGGCAGPALQATATETAGTVSIALWDKGPKAGEMCADFVRHGEVSVDLPWAPAGRAITDR